MATVNCMRASRLWDGHCPFIMLIMQIRAAVCDEVFKHVSQKRCGAGFLTESIEQGKPVGCSSQYEFCCAKSAGAAHPGGASCQ